VWQQQTQHAKATDFVFPSMRERGRKPLYASTFVADHLRPAAKKAGVHIENGGSGFTTSALPVASTIRRPTASPARGRRLCIRLPFRGSVAKQFIQNPRELLSPRKLQAGDAEGFC
jgi:hypothetical protein